MKRWMSLMLVFLLVFGLIPLNFALAESAPNTSAASTDLFANESFETTVSNSAWLNGIAPANWTRYVFSGTPVFAVDSTVAHTGTNSARLEAASTARATLYQQANVERGKTYRISGWLKTENISNQALVRFQVPRPSGNLLINIVQVSGTKDWTYFERNVTIPQDATLPASLKVEAFLETGTGKVWFDDIALQEWVAVQGVSLTPAVNSLQVGDQVALSPQFTPENATNRNVTWSSSNESVATIRPDGMVTAVADGYSIITAKTADGGFTAASVVSVGAPPSLTVDPFEATADEDGGVDSRLSATDTAGGSIAFAKATDPANGVATVYPDGRITYYPNANFHGTDRFMVMAQTGSGGPQFAMATIQVNAVNDAPALDLNWSSTPENTALNGRLQQATDADGDTLAWTKVSDPAHGTVQVNKDGTYVYTPQTGYAGYDGFQVAVSDGNGGSTEGSMQIFVVPDAGELLAKFQSSPSYGQHPRLLANKSDFDRARSLIQTDRYMSAWYQQLQKESAPLLQTSPLPYASGGTNNGAIYDRLIRIALMYQLSGDSRYATRTIQELEALAAYPDWGDRTNNILAMASLSFAVSLSYDWVYEAMTPEQRADIAQAIQDKVLGVANDWYNGVFTHNGENNNINLFDNGNFGLAALAIADASPSAQTAATKALQGMYRKLQQALRFYSPDGAWPEGPAYWHYGGQYLTYMVASMNNVLGTDYGLSSLPGFKNSANYQQQLLGPNGYFNFSDGGISMAQPESMWYASFYNQPELAWHLGDLYDRQGVYDPLYLVLYRPGMFDTAPTQLDSFYGEIESGEMRSAWDDPQALYAAMKGRNETLGSHYDLDAGSFVFDALGYRWAMDLGTEDYSLPGYWDSNYQRWTLYRKKTEGHNTIVVNPVQNPVLQQDPHGTATRIRQESKPRGAFSILDMTNMYSKDAVSMKRGMMLTGDRTQLLVQDEMKLKQPSELYWFMHTQADIQIAENGKAAILSQGDKRLYVKMTEGPADAAFSVMDAEPLPTSPNPDGQTINFGVRKLAVHLTNVSEANLAIWMVPLNDTDPLPTSSPAFTPLDEWSIPDGPLPPHPARPYLDGVTVDGVPIAGFTPKGTYYQVNVPFDSTAIPVVGALGSHPYTVTQATAVPGSARVVVQDENDPSNTNSYTIVFKRLPLIGKPDHLQQYSIAGATASSVPEAAQGHTPEATIDGDLSTRWSAPGKQWIQYDLGEDKPVSALSLAIYNGTTRQQYFDIETSVDGQQWTTLYSGETSGTTEQPETILLPATKARYVRIVGSGNSSNNYNSITETAIYGPIPVSGIQLDRSEAILTEAGQQVQFTAQVSPDNATDRMVAWTSADSVVASVYSNGLVTANGEGTTTITAATEDGGFTATAQVTVDLYGPAIEFDGPSTIAQSDTASMSVNAKDAVSGVASLEVTLDGAPVQASFSIEPLSLSAGKHVIRAAAVDTVGHETVKEFTFTVDVTPDGLDAVLDAGGGKGWIKNGGILESLRAKAREAVSVESDPDKLSEALRALENEVKAQQGKGIDQVFAGLLLADLSYIRQGADGDSQ